ncbi:MAG: sigma-70 family RNA polymerase sigma factor [Verrucomicrobia bacterium]|nr:sigma-70 family RNA polymerase sigma factor [Verrucomicrobiota bacterium]
MISPDFYSAPSSLLRRASSYPTLSAAEEHQLALEGRAGNSSASERIILCNLRLAVSIARDYTGLGLTLDDLVSEGSIGLMKAASKFDPCHRVRFATYAVFWVRHTILRALYNQNRVIRLPAHVVARLLKVKQVLERMTAELGREPNGEELAAETGFRTAQITDLLAVSAVPLSLHAPHGEENSTLEGSIPDEQTTNPALRQEDREQSEQLHRLLKSRLLLTSRERNILTTHFGIGTDQQESFESIGARLGLTSERVRQLHNKGLAKLRRKLKADNTSLAALADYLG